ncbi:hypothetical protein BH10BDE1_BH10BDE1_26420 [soil metagenome]
MTEEKFLCEAFRKSISCWATTMSLSVVFGCATSPLVPSSGEITNAPALPSGAAEAPPVAACRVFISGEDPQDFDGCVESVAADGTLILKPAVIKVVEQRVAAEKKNSGMKHLWMMLTKEKSPNAVFGGPIVAYIGKGPSGVNLARQVAFFDNGPDLFEDGLARSIAKNGKVGFIDETLVTMIREEYDFAMPFQKGLAVACNGCKSEPMKGEHSIVSGGDWLVLNRLGKVLKGPGLSQKEAYDAVQGITQKLKSPNSKEAHP